MVKQEIIYGFSYRVSAFILTFTVIFMLCSCGLTNRDGDIEAEYTELGCPSLERYPNDADPRCVWDMTIYNGYLYTGGGNYDTNRGPVDVFRYNIASGMWENSGRVDDEEVNRFVILNGSLCIPGTDPREGWNLGNYYRWTGDCWEKVRTLPGAVHNFDMTEYDGFIYAALGVERGDCPVVRSEDGGESFYSVEFYKNGKLVDTNKYRQTRVYDFFVLGGSLYATLLCYSESVTYEIYRLEDDRFVFESDWTDRVGQKKINYIIVGGKAVFRDCLFFATGYLYAGKDMKNIVRVRLPNVDTVYDICVNDDTMYVLGSENIGDGTFKISVWKNRSGTGNGFSKLFGFAYDAPAVSFAVDGDNFYFGIGEVNTQNNKNGTVLSVKFPH